MEVRNENSERQLPKGILLRAECSNWGVTESGTSKYFSSDGVRVLCRYNVGAHLAHPPPSK